MIRATSRPLHCVVRRVPGRAVVRRWQRSLRCRHDVPAGCVLGVLAHDAADFTVPIGESIEFADGRLIVIAQLCPRHVLTVPVTSTAAGEREEA